MTRIYEERSSYDASKDAVGHIAIAIECAPGQITALKAELASIRDRAGVYAVDIDHDVRVPQTPAPEEGETHGESTLQLANAAEGEGAGGGQDSGLDAVDVELAADAGDEQPELAGTSGKAEPGSVGGGSEMQVHDETRGDLTGDPAGSADSGAREGTGEDISIVPQGE